MVLEFSNKEYTQLIIRVFVFKIIKTTATKKNTFKIKNILRKTRIILCAAFYYDALYLKH